MLKFALVVISTLVVTLTAQAHPGHGEPDEAFSLIHYLAEPIHAFGAAALIVLVAALLRRCVRHTAARATH